MHFDKFLDDLHYISERVENKKIKNVSELSTMITTIDRNLNHVYDKRYDSHWEIKKYYEKIYPHLKKLHAFIQNNKTVIIDSFDIAVATNNDATVMTRLMNLSIYEDTTNSPISNSEADAIISLTEDLFLSEIRTYISELHYHITPIIDEDTPDIYDDIIYQ